MISDRKRAIAASFGAAAHAYDAAAVVQRDVGLRLAAEIGTLPGVGGTLPGVGGSGARGIEIGCGTGLFTRAVLAACRPSFWLATDLSPGMVVRAREALHGDERVAFACMDGERPALAQAPATSAKPGFDLVCSNMAVQWFDDLGAGLAGLAGLLRPGGWLAVSTLAAGTFAEWREAHRRLGLVAGTPDYPDTAAIRAMVTGCGMEARVEETFIRHAYPDAHAFVTAVKAIGAHATGPTRRPLAPGTLRRVLRTFPAGPVSVTYHVVYAFCRKPAPRPDGSSPEGSP